MVTVFESNILLFIYRQEKIAERYYWKGMTKDVAEYCGTCLVCQRKNKMPKKTVVGPLSGAVVCYLMVLTECLTKWPEVHCIPNKETITVSRCLKKLVGRFGVPEIIISDQGREFCNELNDNFCSSLGIARHICTAYHPQSNGLTERFNQKICACLSKYSEGGKLNWEDDLDLSLLGYRSFIQSYSPFELVYDVKARLPIELDLPPHKFNADKDDSPMEKLMVNSKLLGEKHI